MGQCRAGFIRSPRRPSQCPTQRRRPPVSTPARSGLPPSPAQPRLPRAAIPRSAHPPPPVPPPRPPALLLPPPAPGWLPALCAGLASASDGALPPESVLTGGRRRRWRARPPAPARARAPPATPRPWPPGPDRGRAGRRARAL
eukprot:scaffold23726_cov130-Isochrysis_galbana.AAC.3